MNLLTGNEYGKAESKAPAVITIILIIIAAVLSWKFIPAKIKYMKLEQEVQELLNINFAKEYKDYARGAFNEYTMREKVIAITQKLKVPIKDASKQIVVERTANDLFTVKIDYTEEINLPIVGVKRWDFHLFAQQDAQSGKAK